MIRKQSQKLIEKYGEYLFTGVELLPNIVESGKGSFITDVDGNKILDLNAGQFCSIFGHSWPKLDKIFKAQSKKIIHTGTNTISSELFYAGKQISTICEGMQAKTIFLSTGAEAVECALRFAKGVKKKNGFACFANGYHGLSLGSQSVTFGGLWSLPKVEMIYSVNPPSFHEIKAEEIKQVIDKSLAEVETIFQSHAQDIAGFIMEPIISVGGMIYLPNAYAEGIYHLCQKYGILLVYDECQTGIGRTGKWFAYQHSQVVPDIIIVAKALGAGTPVSAVIFNAKTVSFNQTSLNHFSSHQNDPLSAAISMAVIEEISQQNLLVKITKKGDYFLKKLELLSKKYDFIKNPRGLGLMLSFDIFRPNLQSYIELGKEMSKDLLDKGIMLQSTSHGKTYRLLPNYLVKIKEIDFFIEQLEQTIRKFSN